MLSLCSFLGSCARTGPLELPPDYVKKHTSQQQATAPSASLAPQTHY
jgi:predicted small lipoprotein YifL